MKDKQPLDPYNVNVGGVRLDPYIIAEAFKLPPTIGEALKKLLRLGRKHKTAREDAEECIKTVRRWLEIQDVLAHGDGCSVESPHAQLRAAAQKLREHLEGPACMVAGFDVPDGIWKPFTGAIDSLNIKANDMP